MSLSEKQVRGLVLAISLITLIGGIIGSIYCSHEINELLNWAESTGDPKMTKEYNYQVVKEEVSSLGVWQVVSADIAVIGGLASLALVFRGRFRWKGAGGLGFSLLGAFIILLAILGAIFLGGSGGIIGAVIATLLFLVILFLIRKRLPMRESFFILGGFLMLGGIFLAIGAYLSELFEMTQEFRILFWFFRMVGIGVAILGAFFSLVALCWPRQRADNLGNFSPTLIGLKGDDHEP